jgi:hypothetical protein
MLRQTMHDAILDEGLWQGVDVQSTGIRQLPFPENLDPTPENMANHLRRCGVTVGFWRDQLHPFMQRGIDRSMDSRELEEDIPLEPGELQELQAQVANTIRAAMEQQSVAPVPTTTSPTRPTSRARSMSAPPVPNRGTHIVPPFEASNDDDVPMEAQETTEDVTK